MTTRGYTVLGWLVWQWLRGSCGARSAQNRVKLGAAATVAAVIARGGLWLRVDRRATNADAGRSAAD